MEIGSISPSRRYLEIQTFGLIRRLRFQILRTTTEGEIMSEFLTHLSTVQQAQQDFEWYPTTNEIIEYLCKSLSVHIEDHLYDRRRTCHFGSFLDIGAGNGKVLDAVRDLRSIEKLHAIEKSRTLINLLPADVFILGVDFWNTSLIDKQVDVIFSNPPYSRYVEWTSKILREARPGALVYLVIPERWDHSAEIRGELKEREASHEIVGSFDFENSEDRKARAKVHLLKIEIGEIERNSADPFTKFFEETFTYPSVEADGRSMEEKIDETKMVHRVNLIEALCFLHDARMQELQQNYTAICQLPLDILKEFEISKKSLLESLRMKLAATKKEYWQRLFDGMSEISSRLTLASRRSILNLMQDQTGIDFNRENAYAVVLWVVKNANRYFDTQLIETYEKLVEFANIENYKSNVRIFRTNRFRYDWFRDKESVNYRLKVGHRMVLNNCGGLERCGYSSSRNGLNSQAAGFMADLMTVAGNLGLTAIDPPPREFEWNDSSAQVYRFLDANGQPQSLFRVRAFLNRNMHMQFHPEFIHALNVQHGKLRGWLRDDARAAEELEIPVETARRRFASNFRLTAEFLKLGSSAA
jgi:hypothetical protein